MNNQAATATQNVVVSIYPQGQPRRPELISTTAGSVTITSIHGSFERSDLDAVIVGPHIPSGTRIISIHSSFHAVIGRYQVDGQQDFRHILL